MRFNFLRSSSGDSWPEGVPRLYGDPADRIVPFLDETAIDRLFRLPLVRVVVQVDRDSRSDEELLAGSSRLLIRNLMLLPDVSVRGPEDSPPILRGEDPRDELDTDELLILMSLHRDQILIRVSGREEQILDFRIPLKEIRRQPQTVWDRACLKIARGLNLEASEQVLAGWRRGQPAAAGALERHGALVLHPGAKSNDDIEAWWRLDPGYASMLWELADEPYPSEVLLEALEQDPDNAQLCFVIFCALWQSGGFEPWALQYCRKAIELSPGHGKAHMCLPHAAPKPVSLLVHSELGARFLPTNVFAVSNYYDYLEQWGGRGERMIELARTCLQLDPKNPDGYQRLVEQLTDRRQFDEAVAAAAALCELYEPPMDERTIYCLKQNPETKERMEREGWSPYRDSLRQLAKLDRLARCGEIV